MDFLIKFAGNTGRMFLNYLNYILSISGLLYRILIIFVTRNYSGKTLVRIGIIEQIYFTAVQALWIIIPIALAVGTTFFLQVAQLTSQYEFGKLAVTILIRETSPMVTAILVILRSATAVTVEIGYMNVRKEMDAIQMSGADPIALICLPRLIGITSAILFLFIIFNLVAVFGGFIAAWILSDISLSIYLGVIGKSISMLDVAAGLVKGVTFGVLISNICMYRGFEAATSITEVPAKASKASVDCFFFCLVLNIIISICFSVAG